MAKKKAPNPELKKAYDAYIRFMKLCGMLFTPYSTKPIYNINEIKEDNEYYEHARQIADELGIFWDGMTHEDSNRIMLALIDDCYNDIQVDKEKDYCFKVSIEEVVPKPNPMQEDNASEEDTISSKGKGHSKGK